MSLPRPLLVAVMGPTASGKTAVAEALANDLDAQLINADAFQVYRGMDIGTAKPLDKERYALLDLKDPNESYGVGEFCMRAQALLHDLWRKGRSAVVVGGTGLYIRALFEQYQGLEPEPDASLREELNRRHAAEGLAPLLDQLKELAPERLEGLDTQNPVRVKRTLERVLSPKQALNVELPPYHRVKLGLVVGLLDHQSRIEARLRWMVQNGWVEETRQLIGAGFCDEDPGFRAIGYRQMASFIRGESQLEEAIATTIAETRRYAKRQRTWLRSEPGLETIRCDDRDPIEEARQAIRVSLL